MKERNDGKIERRSVVGMQVPAFLLIGMLGMNSFLGCEDSKNRAKNLNSQPSIQVVYRGSIEDYNPTLGKNPQGEAMLTDEAVKEGSRVTHVQGLRLVFDDRIERYIDYDSSGAIGDHKGDYYSVTFIKKAGWISSGESTTYFYSPEGAIIDKIGKKKRGRFGREKIIYKADDINPTSQTMVSEGKIKLREADNRFQKYVKEIQAKSKADLK